MLTDSHCHLEMLGEDLAGVLARMRTADVTRAVTIGTDVASSEWAVAAARAHPELAATVGLHPHEARHGTAEVLARLASLAGAPEVVGVGEAGLDYHYDHSPRDEQRRVFRWHIGLAKRAGVALVIHTREAWEDTFAILADEGPPARLVFHCFTGGPEEAAHALSLGAVLSFSGILTFPKADAIREAAAAAPLERIAVETDAPYLTPVPHRGRPNEPAYVVHVAEALAEIRGVAPAAVASATSRAAARLFGLADPGTPGPDVRGVP